MKTKEEILDAQQRWIELYDQWQNLWEQLRDVSGQIASAYGRIAKGRGANPSLELINTQEKITSEVKELQFRMDEIIENLDR